jgi:glycosyltransferase involved in cell wall biosynthesis
VPSRHEGVPNVLLEAQAWGLPAVVSDIPGNSLVVQDGVTGLIVPVDDVEALTAALVEMLLQPSQRRKMGKAAREKMRSCFSMSGVAKAYHDCYRSILGDHFAKTKTFSG